MPSPRRLLHDAARPPPLSASLACCLLVGAASPLCVASSAPPGRRALPHQWMRRLEGAALRFQSHSRSHRPCSLLRDTGSFRRRIWVLHCLSLPHSSLKDF